MSIIKVKYWEWMIPFKLKQSPVGNYINLWNYFLENYHEFFFPEEEDAWRNWLTHVLTQATPSPILVVLNNLLCEV